MYKGRTSATRLTLVGRVASSRRRWARSDGSVTPVDAWIDAAAFRRAAENLEAAAGLSMSVETLRRVVEAEGKLVGTRTTRRR